MRSFNLVWKSLIAAATIAASGALAQNALASPLISDDFDSGTAQANWAGDTVFTSITTGNASVDLVGPGFYGSLALSGNSVDLDGSTGSGNHPAGDLQSITSLPLGNYEVTFELAGNLRNSPAQTTVVSIGGSSQSLTPLNTQGYMLETLFFTNVSGNLSFVDLGPSDQQGNLLDNVSVSATPLPATWSMLLAGFVGLGFLAYRAGKNRSVVAAA